MSNSSRESKSQNGNFRETHSSSGGLKSAAQDSTTDGGSVLAESQFQPSELSLKVAKFKSTILDTVRSREVLPQPLFWSLFNAQLLELRKQKAEARLLRKLTLGIES